MHSRLLLVAFLGASALAYGQSFEASVSGGVSQLSGGSNIGGDGTGNTYGLDNGFRLTFRMDFNLKKYLGAELGYAYNRTHLTADGQDQGGMAIHQGFVDALWHFTPEGSRIRPFVAGGIQFSNFVPPGSSASYGQGDNKFGVNYGGGVKVKLTSSWELRFDVRQYETGKPFNLVGASGRLLQNEFSAGVGFTI